MDVVETAQRLADDVLFPAALETDRADVVPIELLDALAAAGLYGLASPAAFGGYDADFETVCAVWETLSSGCLTTAFVWGQHVGLVHSLAESGTPALRATWLELLTRGTIRAGLALGVTARCCRLLGRSGLDEELAACRRRLDALDPGTIEADRAAAGALAVRAAAALMTTTGSRSLLHTEHSQRLAREALFTAVYALRPASRNALLDALGAT